MIVHRPHRVALLLLAFVATSSVFAGELPDPDDYDLVTRLDRKAYVPGGDVELTVGVVARQAGIEGWSYGMRHDSGLLTVDTATIEGTDVPGSLAKLNFNVIEIIEDENGVQLGFIQGVILSLSVEPVEIPVTDFFSMARVSYSVSGNACDGAGNDLTTDLRFVEDLAAAGNPPIDLTLTIGGRGVVPTVVRDAQVTIACAAPDARRLVFGPKDPCELVADRASTFDLQVHSANDADGVLELQAWSYGVALDTTLLTPREGMPGADAAALNGGSGPEFVNYNLDDRSADGTVRGVSVGVVISLMAPGTALLPVPTGASVHLDTLRLASAIEIEEGAPEQMTQLRFADQELGGDRPLEIILVVEGNSVIPDFSDVKTLTLRGGGARPLFLRGDANNDLRLDIADAVWIIRMLFYGGPMTACRPAADANGNEMLDLADALYIVNYQLQSGATPNNLFPAPPAPFPGCGTADGVSLEDCPVGSHLCSQ